MKTNAKVSTAPEAGKEATITNVEFDWTGMSQDDIVAMAQQSLVIKLQGQWRRKGIPVGDVAINVVDYRPGTRAERGPVNVSKAVEAMTVEQKQALLAQIQAQLAG